MNDLNVYCVNDDQKYVNKKQKNHFYLSYILQGNWDALKHENQESVTW